MISIGRFCDDWKYGFKFNSCLFTSKEKSIFYLLFYVKFYSYKLNWNFFTFFPHSRAQPLETHFFYSSSLGSFFFISQFKRMPESSPAQLINILIIFLVTMNLVPGLKVQLKFSLLFLVLVYLLFQIISCYVICYVVPSRLTFLSICIFISCKKHVFILHQIQRWNNNVLFAIRIVCWQCNHRCNINFLGLIFFFFPQILNRL